MWGRSLSVLRIYCQNKRSTSGSCIWTLPVVVLVLGCTVVVVVKLVLAVEINFTYRRDGHGAHRVLVLHMHIARAALHDGLPRGVDPDALPRWAAAIRAHGQADHVGEHEQNE